MHTFFTLFLAISFYESIPVHQVVQTNSLQKSPAK